MNSGSKCFLFSRLTPHYEDQRAGHLTVATCDHYHTQLMLEPCIQIGNPDLVDDLQFYTVLSNAVFRVKSNVSAVLSASVHMMGLLRIMEWVSQRSRQTFIINESEKHTCIFSTLCHLLLCISWNFYSYVALLCLCSLLHYVPALLPSLLWLLLLFSICMQSCPFPLYKIYHQDHSNYYQDLWLLFNELSISAQCL